MSDPGSLDVLVVSQFFSPEMGAPAARFHDFGKLLVERGHRVTVVTGFPNSPSGVVPESHRGKLRQTEWIDGIRVLRGWLYTSPRLSPFTKSLGFGSFAASASLRVLLGGLSADVVVATSPPPTVGIPGWLAARRLGAPMVFDVRDIWPEAILASGRLKSAALVRFLEAIERGVYGSAAAVTVVTEGKRARLIEKGVAEDKLAVIPNGVDLGRFDETDPAGAALLAEHGVDRERFVVLYAGIFNPPQGLDVLLDAAAGLRADASPAGRRPQFVLVGNGAERDRLVARVRDEQLGDDVKFLPEQPRERIPGLLQAADAIAVTLRPRRDTHTVPSKIYEALASGRPLLLSADGAPDEIVRASEGGLVSAAGDAAGLRSNVQRLIADPAEAAAMGERARVFAASHDRRILVERFEARLQRVVAEARAHRRSR
ncbi:MAG: glycosyltransferase family 4 protein [Myxococcales bacterium]|nr:glycosyltransferase family 4 protein [Myxococcales bacterium]